MPLFDVDPTTTRPSSGHSARGSTAGSGSTGALGTGPRASIGSLGGSNTDLTSASSGSNSSGVPNAGANTSANARPYAPPLSRNSACVSCKKRKLRCDAVRPTCGACRRAQQAAKQHGSELKSVPPGPCEWPPPVAMAAAAPGAGAIEEEDGNFGPFGADVDEAEEGSVGRRTSDGSTSSNAVAAIAPPPSPGTALLNHSGAFSEDSNAAKTAVAPEGAIGWAGEAPLDSSQNAYSQPDHHEQSQASQSGIQPAFDSMPAKTDQIKLKTTTTPTTQRRRKSSSSARKPAFKSLLAGEGAAAMREEEDLPPAVEAVAMSQPSSPSAKTGRAGKRARTEAGASTSAPSQASSRPAIVARTSSSQTAPSTEGSTGTSGTAEDKRRIAELEAKVKDLERHLERVTLGGAAEAGGNGEQVGKEGAARKSAYDLQHPDGRVEKMRLRYENERRAHNFPSPPSGASAAAATASALHSDGTGFPFSTVGPGPAIPLATPDLSPSVPLPEPSTELLLQGWDADLPAPDTVLHLIDIFFTKSPMRTLLCRSTFMLNMMLPHSHPCRPHPALLHAMIAAAAPLSPFMDMGPGSDDANGRPHGQGIMLLSHSKHKSAADVIGTPMVGMNFTEMHIHLARAKIEAAVITSHRNPLDWMQAAALICFALFDKVRTMEYFFLISVMGRATSPTGVNRMGRRNDHSSLFPPPASVAEEHERRLVMWHFYIADVYGGSSIRFWESVFPDEENQITTALPPSMHAFQLSLDAPPSPQTLSSPDLFRTHHIDAFTLHLKSAILLKRVRVYVSRNMLALRVVSKPPQGFVALNNAVDDFMRTFPAVDAISPDLIVARANTFLALINLHEFLAHEGDDQHRIHQRLQQGTMGLLHLVRYITSTSFDLGLLHPQTFFAWGIGIVQLLRLAERNKKRGDTEAVASIAEDISTILWALQQAGRNSWRAKRLAAVCGLACRGHMSTEDLK